VHSSGESQVASVSQGSDYQSAIVALVFEPIHIAGVGLEDVAVTFSLALLHELQLLLPIEVIDAGTTLLQLIYNVSIPHFDSD